MRIPVSIAWLIVLSGLFTAGLLRRNHDHIPESPFLHPAAGSLLFLGILFLLLVTARERGRRVGLGRGIRLGTITPLLLILLLEKWLSLVVYEPLFLWLAPDNGVPALMDAQFRLMAGIVLLSLCWLLARLTIPTARRLWRAARPARWPRAALQAIAVVLAMYVLIAGLAWSLGGDLRLKWPPPGSVLAWVLLSQAVLAFAEEVYYRGLVMGEIERVAPRLGVRAPAGRRWLALIASAAVFSIEHHDTGLPMDEWLRRFVFTLALGVLFGLLVMLSRNLHFAGAIHAWINWLLLGAAPHFVTANGQPALPAGTYIGITLILAFVSCFLLRRRADARELPLASTAQRGTA